MALVYINPVKVENGISTLYRVFFPVVSYKVFLTGRLLFPMTSAEGRIKAAEMTLLFLQV